MHVHEAIPNKYMYTCSHVHVYTVRLKGNAYTHTYTVIYTCAATSSLSPLRQAPPCRLFQPRQSLSQRPVKITQLSTAARWRNNLQRSSLHTALQQKLGNGANIMLSDVERK